MDVVDNGVVCNDSIGSVQQQIMEQTASSSTTTTNKKLNLSSFHPGLIGKSWDQWDLQDTVTDEELQSLRDRVTKKYGFSPRRGMHKNDEPSRIPCRYMYLFGSYPMDDIFSVSECAYCGHLCKSQYIGIHLQRDCTKKPEATLTDEDSTEETNFEQENEEQVEKSPVSSSGSESLSDRRSCSSNSNSRSDSGRSSSCSRSRSRSRSSSPEEREGSSVHSASISDGEGSRGSHSGSVSSRSRSRSPTPTSSPEPFVEINDVDNENPDDCESIGESESSHGEGVSPDPPTASLEGYYEILPHISTSPADPDLLTKDLKTYPGCQVLSPSNSNSLIPNLTPTQLAIKPEPFDLEEEQIQFPIILGDLNGAGGSVSGFDTMGTPVDPLELESAATSNCTSVGTPDQSPSSPVFVSVGTPSQPKVAKKKKKKVRDEPRKVIPLKDRCFNPEEHCGVNNSDGVPCTRSLTCKSHSMASRRAVQGRSQSFDVLLSSHKKARDEAKAAKAGPVDVGDENDITASLYPTDQKPALSDARLSWTCPSSVKLTLTNMLRGSVMNLTKTSKGGKTSYKGNSSSVGTKKGGKGMSKNANNKLDRFLQVVAGENVLDENGNEEDSMFDSGLYGNQSVLLRNPLDPSDDEINEEDWEWVPLARIEKRVNIEEPDVQQSTQMLTSSASNYVGGRNTKTTFGFEEVRHQINENMLISTKAGYDQYNARKRPLSPANIAASGSQIPLKKLRTDGTLEQVLPQSTLSLLATQLPNPTKSILGPRGQSSETLTNTVSPKPISNFGVPTTEVSLKDFQSLQLVSTSGSPPISLASLLGIRPQLKQETAKLNSNSFKQGDIGSSTGVQTAMTAPVQLQLQRTVANVTGRTQPRKQQFPTVKHQVGGTKPSLTTFPGKGSHSVTVKLPVKRGGLSPAICLVNPEQQLQQQPQFGHYQLHLPEEPSNSIGATGSPIGTTALSSQQQQRERNIAALQQQLQLQLQQQSMALAGVKQESGSGSPQQQQRGTATSSTTQLGEYTLQLPEQGNSIPNSGDNSWASLSQERSGQRRLEDAPVADSELSKLLASQFEFED